MSDLISPRVRTPIPTRPPIPAHETLVCGRPPAEDYQNPFLPPAQSNLRSYTRHILLAMVETIMPRNEKLDFDIADQVVNYVDRFLTYLPSFLGYLLPAGIYMMEFGAIFFSGRFRRFSTLTPDERRLYIDSWVNSRFSLRRDMIKGLKALIMMGYFDHPDTQKAVGYEHQPHVDRMRKYRQEKYGGEL